MRVWRWVIQGWCGGSKAVRVLGSFWLCVPSSTSWFMPSFLQGRPCPWWCQSSYSAYCWHQGTLCPDNDRREVWIHQLDHRSGVRAVVPSGPSCPSLLPSHHVSLTAWCCGVLSSTCLLRWAEPSEGTTTGLTHSHSVALGRCK